MRDYAGRADSVSIKPAYAPRFRWFPEHARLRQGSGHERVTGSACDVNLNLPCPRLYRNPARSPRPPRAFFCFAQGGGHIFKTGIFRKESGFGCHFRTIRFRNIFLGIVRGRIYGEEGWAIFKCPAVLYVDPQNLMTNRRNPPSGRVSVSR
jgi:hypothetical protein